MNKIPFQKLKDLDFNVTMEDNFSNPAIKEIHSEDREHSLSYLPKDQINWAGDFGDPDCWGWAILDNEDGYIVDDKHYHDDIYNQILLFLLV